VTSDLKPYVNYVPVANDFHLVERVMWANSRPNLIEEIGNRAEEWSDI